MSDYVGLILGAGKGSRMRPFSPKEMLPYINKSIIVHSIDLLKSVGINFINIVVGEGKYNVEEHVGNGNVFDVNVSYDFQQVLDGDAGGIRCANITKNSSVSNVIVLFGDELLADPKDIVFLKNQFERFKDEPDYVGAIAFSNQPAVIPVGSKVFPYGVALLENDLIKRIYEKPDSTLLPDFTVNGVVKSIATFYIFKKEALFSIIEDLYKEGVVGEYHLSDAVKLALSKGKQFSGFTIKGKLDMGRPLPYLLALKEWFINSSDEDVLRAASDWDVLASKFKH